MIVLPAAQVVGGAAGAVPPAPTPTPADDDAPPAAPLPLGDDEFLDDILAIVCNFLGVRELGRLACVARRFTQPTLTEPGGGGAGGAKLSPIEEGARRQLVVATASAVGARGVEAGRLEGETWMHALWRATAPRCKYCCTVLPVPGSLGNNRKCTRIAYDAKAAYYYWPDKRYWAERYGAIPDGYHRQYANDAIVPQPQSPFCRA